MIGKYISGDTFSLASVWDTTGKFLRVFIFPDSAWAKLQPFTASPVYCESNGDVVLAVDFFPFKLYVVSIRGKGELLDSFTVRIKGHKNFSTPEGSAAEEYDPFIKWMEDECRSNQPVLGGLSYCLSNGMVVFKSSQCASVVDINMSPCLGIYDPAKKKVIWTKDWDASVLGGIRGDTLLLNKKGDCGSGRLQKAVIK